jgi:hypothetical protein
MVDGSADLQPLDTVEIKGVGQRFNGKALVSGVTHTIDVDGWRSQLRLGLSADWFARTAELAEVPAAGLLPPADKRSQKPGLMMASIYRTLLHEIESAQFPVLHQRVRLTPLRKFWLAWKVQALGRF